ncbi:MAG: hypothetical protein ACTSRG_17535 [Candidatus Helarchaeota archaeon]
MALIGGIMAAAGFGLYSGTIKSIMTLVLFWILGGLLGWFLLTAILLDATILIIGVVMAIIGGGLLLFLQINKQFLEGGI